MDRDIVAPQFVSIDHRRLAFRRAGQGGPLVVLEAGAGDAGDVWDAVFAGVATFTGVVAYDRAGLGASDPVSALRVIQDMVSDLRVLLHRVKPGGPYVLVGHSFGGPIVQLYTQQYPDDVSGLVLVDPSHPDALVAFSRAFPNLAESQPEGIDLEKTAQQMRVLQSVGAIPLVVLAAGSRVYPSGVPSAELRHIYRLWTNHLQELPNLSSRGSWVLVKDSSHYIHVDRPETVVEAIHGVVQGVRDRDRTTGRHKSRH